MYPETITLGNALPRPRLDHPPGHRHGGFQGNIGDLDCCPRVDRERHVLGLTENQWRITRTRHDTNRPGWRASNGNRPWASVTTLRESPIESFLLLPLSRHPEHAEFDHRSPLEPAPVGNCQPPFDIPHPAVEFKVTSPQGGQMTLGKPQPGH